MENMILFLLIIAIPAAAQLYVTLTYNKYLKTSSQSKNTGYDIAKKILENNGLKDMYIVETKGTMSDHYDSARKTIRLSTEVYKKNSIASIAISAHECGHAIQDKEGYSFMKIRSFIFPLVNLGTKLAYTILLIGFIFSILDLVWVGIALVSLGLILQLITLPVEFNASKRAKEEITKYNLVNPEEYEGVNRMLNAAALTYVAGVLASALEILRLVLIFASKRD
ncbi:MAG: zinc metallopeptidase [Bacilli bacterium]|nr:zinc metallopeptidase [Bacilli bacterium]